MMRNFFIYGFIIFISFNLAFASQLHSEDEITIDLHQVSLVDALQLLAKSFQQNIIISPAVSGVISLHFHQVSAREAFATLLKSQELVKDHLGKTWLISPRAELVKLKENDIKSREIINEAAELVTRVFQIHYAKAEEIANVIQSNHVSLLSKRGQVHVDSRTNILCLQDTDEQMLKLNRVIQRLDVPVQQVLIEARLATVDHDFERELGIHFSVRNNESTNQHQYSLAVARLVDGSLLDIKLTALEKEGHGELISSPSLFTANQQTASIESGEEIPYQEVSRSGATSVAFKKAVLSLKVTPQVLPGHKVLLQLQVNQDRPSNRIVLGVPAISTRQMSTHILVKNGETVVLGGIYESNKEQGQQRLPFLGRIPLLGVLFQDTKKIEAKRELLIFVTPRIIDDP